MKDTETLATHNIKDGMTVHLVIKSGGAAANNAAAAAGASGSSAPTSAAGSAPTQNTGPAGELHFLRFF